MTEAIEKVARAIWLAAQDDMHGTPPDPLENLDAAGQERMRLIAKAALSTTREPSEAELIAATVAVSDFIYQGPGPQPMELKLRARDCARAALIAAAGARMGE